MANYSTLTAAVQAVVKTNGNGEITGANMQTTLLSMINSLGAGYQFIGVATPSTNPTVSDQKIFYICGQPGTYTNFNNLVSTGIAVLYYDTAWHIANANASGIVYDISAANGGATYADLATALGNVPASIRRGGMTISFVQSSDNKYVQYICKTSAWSNTPTDWEKVNNVSVSQNTLLIDGEDKGNIIENSQISEYACVTIDAVGKLLESIYTNGKKRFYADVDVDGDFNVKGVINGGSLVEKEANKSLINEEYAESVDVIDNPEYLQVVTDNEDKVISYRDKAGVFHELVGVESPDIIYLNSIANKFFKPSLLAINQIDSIEEYGTPETCLSIHDQGATPYDNTHMAYCQVLKISDSMYYMYYEAHGVDSSYDQETGYFDDYHSMIQFAYSTDGINWVRDFPSGVTPPPTGEGHAIQCYMGAVGSYRPSFGCICVFKALWDNEYPFRAITSDGETILFKSSDGINFVYGKILDPTWRDCQPSVIIRGNAMKIYNRVRPTNEGRFIGVMYCDLEGNILSPSRYMFGENNLYQASAGALDDRRDILFPTTFRRTELYPNDVQGVECYIVDGDKVLPVSIDQDVFLEDGKFHSIYPACGGLVNIGNELYLYYTVSEDYHDTAFYHRGEVPNMDIEIRRIKLTYGNILHITNS